MCPNPGLELWYEFLEFCNIGRRYEAATSRGRRPMYPSDQTYATPSRVRVESEAATESALSTLMSPYSTDRQVHSRCYQDRRRSGLRL